MILHRAKATCCASNLAFRYSLSTSSLPDRAWRLMDWEFCCRPKAEEKELFSTFMEVRTGPPSWTSKLQSPEVTGCPRQLLTHSFACDMALGAIPSTVHHCGMAVMQVWNCVDRHNHL